MRHAKKGYKLGRTASHRRATLAALSSALIEHKQIRTTLTKAKAARQFIEPLITRAREDSTHNRRLAFRYLRNKFAVTELFDSVAERIGDRPGGYTRIVRLGQRSGDSAEMAILELVDYNESVPADKKSRRRRTRRGTRRSKAAQVAATVEEAQPESVEEPESDVVEEPEAEVNEEAEPVSVEEAESDVAEASESDVVEEPEAETGEEPESEAKESPKSEKD